MPMRDCYLDVLTLEDCEQARLWRNAQLETLRTSYPLTKEQQAAFYRDVVCNRQSPHQYYAFLDRELDGEMVAMVGLTNIDWVNGHAELSLLVPPTTARVVWVYDAALDLLLHWAFDQLRLVTVFGECYHCNPQLKWWKLQGHGSVELPNRKLSGGKHYSSTLFWFTNRGRP